PGTPGVHPLPEELLQIWSIPIAGLSWNEVGNLLSGTSLGALVSTGFGNLVISSSLTYDDPTFAEASLAERALDALAWRMDTAGQVATGPVLHVTASGTGELQAAFASPFALAAYQDDLPAVVLEWAPDDDPGYLATLQAVWASLPAAAQIATGNVVTVGASGPDGLALPLSPDDEMVRDPGIGVPGPCSLPTLLCVNGIQEAFGSGAATPQVAGLAAYLWSLKPTLSPVGVFTHLTTAFLDGSTPGFTDGYAAVLALDPNLLDPRVRRTILDLDDNGQFDQVDVSLYLAAFEFESSDLRFDLNGDTFVGGSGTAWFDLDANGITPNYTDVTLDLGCMEKVFNEKAATDRDILVYYAYSSLYDGDEKEREALLEECGGSVVGVATVGRYDVTATATAHILGNGPGQSFAAIEEAGGSLAAAKDTSGTGETYSASASGSASITWAIAFSAETGGLQLATWSGDLATTADISIMNNGWGIAGGSASTALHLPLEVTGAPVGWTLTASGGGDNVRGRYRGLGISSNETTLIGTFTGTL
ncbi:S8/S53 family peptidase, partial [bacterium]|nr:S8/S53 family peptidase [bacterium]